MRSLNRSKVRDMISISSLQIKCNMLSVNQLNASIKLLEIWKALNVEDYPLKVERHKSTESRVSTRADINERPIPVGKSNLTQKTCVSDAIHVWNLAPNTFTDCTSLTNTKTEIKKFVKTLPI